MISTEEAIFYRALYRSLYLIVVFVLTVIAMSQYRHCDVYRKHIGSNMSSTIIALIFAFFIGIRPHRGFEDTGNYVEYYDMVYGTLFQFDWGAENFLFDNLLNFMASLGVPVTLFFIVIAIIYFVGTAIACGKLFPGNTLLAFVTYLGAFSTFSYGTNGVKAGAAAAFFLLALAYRERKIFAVFLLWISLGFHHSMQAPIVAFIISYFYQKDKYYFYGWVFCLLMAAAHVTFFQSFFSNFTDERGLTDYLYVGKTTKTVSGFRPDFILYSAVPMCIGYYIIIKKRIQSPIYSFLWRVYTLTNSVFLLCTYANFINRIAYLSWLMYPIVLLYPFVNITCSNYQKKYVGYAVYGHLFFTLFMEIFYYGI